MKLIKTLGAYFFALFLIACNDNSKEAQSLKQENESLRNEISKLKKEKPGYAFQAVVIPRSSELKLGEDYEAQVHLAIVDNKNPPYAVLYNRDQNGLHPTSDTLPYDSEFASSYYKVTPKNIGTFSWIGGITREVDGEKIEYLIESEYTVKK